MNSDKLFLFGYIIGLLALIVLLVFNWSNGYIRSVLLFVVIILLVNLFFGKRLESWANDFMIKYM